MQLSDQVVNLDLSKRLHELGIDVFSLFYGDIRSPGQIFFSLENYKYGEWTINEFQVWRYTSAELGAMLPVGLHPSRKTENNQWKLQISFPLVVGPYNLNSTKVENIRENTESDCRAKALIYCIEKEIVKVEDINNALENA